MAKVTNDVPARPELPEVESDDGDDAPEPRELVEAERDDSVQEELPLDQVFEILRNQRRRYVLHFLNEVEGKISMGELSERIAALENGKDVHEISSSERKRVYVGLYQCHLPKMDGMDVISFNKPRGIIEAGPNADIFDQYLENEQAGQFHWHKYYAGMSILGGVVLLAALAARGMTGFPVMEVAVVGVVAAFFGVSAVNLWWSTEGTDAERSGAAAGAADAD